MATMIMMTMQGRTYFYLHRRAEFAEPKGLQQPHYSKFDSFIFLLTFSFQFSLFFANM